MSSKLGGIFSGLIIARLIRPLDGRAWPATIGLFFLCTVGVATYHLWSHYGDTIVSQPKYQLDPNRLRITPQPDYIRSDVKEAAITLGRLTGANLLDPQLVLQVRQAFAVQPWVKQVRSVNKSFPSTVEVDLVYRRPIAMVETPAGMFPPHDYEGLLPIDGQAYLLPVEVSEQEATRFPKIAGIDSSPTGPPGSPWGDIRVAEAARIVALLEEIWDELGLLKVEVPPKNSPLENTDETFYLITKQRNRVRWGSAPGAESTGEESAQEKAVALREYARSQGSLDTWVEQHRKAEANLSDLLDWSRLNL